MVQVMFLNQLTDLSKLLTIQELIT